MQRRLPGEPGAGGTAGAGSWLRGWRGLGAGGADAAGGWA